MEGKKLYPLREDCTELQLCCHKNINRVIEMMSHYPKHSKVLGKYAKLCIVLEKLCEYICSCCCNTDNVSNNILSEHKSKCNQMIAVCKKINSFIDRDDGKYIRCNDMIKLCSKYTKKRSRKRSLF